MILALITGILEISLFILFVVLLQVFSRKLNKLEHEIETLKQKLSHETK